MKFFKYVSHFKEADCIVISEPYWDLGFPEKTGIVYKEDEGGRPVLKWELTMN